MPSQAYTVELFDKLEPDGGTRKAYVGSNVGCVETNKETGQDQFVLSFPLSLAIPVTKGWAPRIVYEDGSIVEYLVNIIEEDFDKDLMTLTCLGAVTRLAYPDCAMANGITSSSPSSISTPVGLSVAVGSWPSTTISPVTTSGDTDLSYLLKLVAAIDATLANGVAPCVMQFTPTISGGKITTYTITATTTVAAGTAHLLFGKNFLNLVRRHDYTDPTFPVVGYTLAVADLFRHAPTKFPLDKLNVYQTCRLEYPDKGINVITRIVSLTTDHSNSVVTVVELGTPIRRLPNTVSTVSTAVAPVTPGSTGWTNADIAAAAAIDYSKLALAGKIEISDIDPAAHDTLATPATLVVRDGAGDITAAGVICTELDLNSGPIRPDGSGHQIFLPGNLPTPGQVLTVTSTLVNQIFTAWV